MRARFMLPKLRTCCRHGKERTHDVGPKTFMTTTSGGESQDPQLVSWRHDGSIGIITLDQPETFNALTVEMGEQFHSLVQDLSHDMRTHLNIHAVVLQGAKPLSSGDDQNREKGQQRSGAFSAGGNFDWLRNLKNNSVSTNADSMLAFYKSFLCIRQLPVPVIASIHGPAVGAGAGLALACDLRVTCHGPKQLGFNFTRLGIHSGMGASHFLSTALPSTALVNEIMFTGKFLSGQECLDLGLVNRLVDHSDQVEEASITLAKEIASKHPLAVRSMTQTLRQTQDQGLEAALQREAHAQALCYNRNDWGEGLDAVLERRDPTFGEYHEE